MGKRRLDRKRKKFTELHGRLIDEKSVMDVYLRLQGETKRQIDKAFNRHWRGMVNEGLIHRWEGIRSAIIDWELKKVK